MPVIKSARKKLRQDKKRTEQNMVVEDAMRLAIKKAKKSPTAESVRLATKTIDKAVKNHLVHKNKASRVKSALAKLLGGKTITKPVAKKATKKPHKKSSK